jgi:hypothetical protein
MSVNASQVNLGDKTNLRSCEDCIVRRHKIGAGGRGHPVESDSGYMHACGVQRKGCENHVFLLCASSDTDCAGQQVRGISRRRSLNVDTHTTRLEAEKKNKKKRASRVTHAQVLPATKIKNWSTLCAQITIDAILYDCNVRLRNTSNVDFHFLP